MDYFCPECNAQVTDADTVCPYCCYTLRRETPICRVETFTPKKEVPKSAILAGIIAAVVLTIAAIMLIYWNSTKPETITKRVEELMAKEMEDAESELEIQSIYYNRLENACYVDFVLHRVDESAESGAIIDLKEEKVYYKSIRELYQLTGALATMISDEENVQKSSEQMEAYGYDPIMEIEAHQGKKSWKLVYGNTEATE